MEEINKLSELRRQQQAASSVNVMQASPRACMSTSFAVTRAAELVIVVWGRALWRKPN